MKQISPLAIMSNEVQRHSVHQTALHLQRLRHRRLQILLLQHMRMPGYQLLVEKGLMAARRA